MDYVFLPPRYAGGIAVDWTSWTAKVEQTSAVNKAKARATRFNELASRLCNTRWQIYFSAVAAVFLSYGQVVATEGEKLPFESAAAFQSFLFGIGTICGIIAPLTFGLLIQQGHKVHAEKLALFVRYQDLVIELRNYLKDLYDSKEVSNQYTEFLSSLEMTKSSDLDGPPEAFYWWNWAAMGLIRWMEDEAAREDTEIDFDEVHHGLLPRLSVIEDLLSSIQVNAIQRAVIAVVLVDPVRNLFSAVATVLLLAGLSSVWYSGIIPRVYFGVVAFILIFVLLSIFQIGRYAHYEAKNIMSEKF